MEPSSKQISPYDLFILFVTTLAVGLALATFLPSLEGEPSRILRSADMLLSFILLTDFFIRLYQAEEKWAFLKWGWIDFLGSLPALPIVRPFRIIRMVRVVNQIRNLGVGNLWRSLISKLPESTLWGGLSLVVPTILIAGWWITQAESEACAAAGANICSLSDGIWWAFVTVTTVGYGDRVPVSNAGRILAAFLMTVGVGLFGILTSYLASLFVASDETDLRLELREIQNELAEIKRLLKEKNGQD
ncbi:MAG: ion channel [Chloroflexota bacterium]